MISFRQGLIAASLIHAAFASPTSPLVAWSSLSTELLPTHSTCAQVDDFFNRWVFSDDACKFDAVILVNQPGLHVSDLRTLSPASSFTRMLSSAPSSVQLPFVELSADNSRDYIVNDISQRCVARMVSLAEAKSLHQEEISGGKFVVNVQVPALEISSSRKSQMAVTGQQLADELEGLTSAFPNHLVIYSDWQQSTHTPVANLMSRQDAPSPSKVAATGGILKRYQILSPGLILSLFLAFFVLLPIVMVGIQALASIQSPVRLDGKMLAEYRQKKDQ
ncbi:hypothetical protein EUX98_g2029 [Antrodiella citrinella]|uniref:Protein BIG1 n=1 Tax=Antrodiella citrinella TaxID=2447956 RepID=A0A4S4N2W3_9APHY|nr:hypothetical protein EUX98_g2029 [Antrodiella citrinella]